MFDAADDREPGTSAAFGFDGRPSWPCIPLIAGQRPEGGRRAPIARGDGGCSASESSRI